MVILLKNDFEVVSKKKQNSKTLKNLIFTFNVCRFVKSNAIVLTNNDTTVGIGSGQPSRLDSCKIASDKALKFVPEKIINSVAASDAFFPFTDGIKTLQVITDLEKAYNEGSDFKLDLTIDNENRSMGHSEVIKEGLEKTGWSSNQIGMLIPHQANLRQTN